MLRGNEGREVEVSITSSEKTKIFFWERGEYLNETFENLLHIAQNNAESISVEV